MGRFVQNICFEHDYAKLINKLGVLIRVGGRNHFQKVISGMVIRNLRACTIMESMLNTDMHAQ